MTTEKPRPTFRRDRREVIDETGRVHPSITSAAVERGLTISGVWGRCRLQRGGWRFADEQLRQPVAPTTRKRG